MASSHIVYITLVGLLGFFIFLWVHVRISRFKQNRVHRASKIDLDEFEALPVEELSKKEKKKQKRTLEEGVKQRFSIIRRTIYLAIGVIWIIALIFPFIGRLPSTYISIFIAIITVMVGIASRPFVESLFSGIVISFSDQLHVGDTLIIDDQYGTVEDISITHTKIKTWEWKRYVIPNSRMLTKEFIHLPLKEQGLWATVEFWVSYDADLERVKEIAENVAAGFVTEDSREKPVCWVRRMEKDSVVCCVACLTDSPSAAWMLKSSMSIGLSKAFREHNIPTNITHLEIDSKAKV